MIQNRGLTLVGLLVVIVSIVILSVVLLVVPLKYRREGNIVGCQANLDSIGKG